MLALWPLSGAIGKRMGAPHAVGGAGMFGEWLARGLGSWSPIADGGLVPGTLVVPLLGCGGFSMSCRPTASPLIPRAKAMALKMRDASSVPRGQCFS